MHKKEAGHPHGSAQQYVQPHWHGGKTHGSTAANHAVPQVSHSRIPKFSPACNIAFAAGRTGKVLFISVLINRRSSHPIVTSGENRHKVWPVSVLTGRRRSTSRLSSANKHVCTCRAPFGICSNFRDFPESKATTLAIDATVQLSTRRLRELDDEVPFARFSCHSHW